MKFRIARLALTVAAVAATVLSGGASLRAF